MCLLSKPVLHSSSAKESNQSSNNSYHGHRDARDRPTAEAALVDRGVRGVDGRRLRDVAGDWAGVTSRSGAAHAVGDAFDITVIRIALHTRISRSLVVPSEALGACLRVTASSALRASGWARGTDSTSCLLSIGTRSTLSIIPRYCCAHRAPRKRLCVVASTRL